jgi:hypothetical protein
VGASGAAEGVEPDKAMAAPVCAGGVSPLGEAGAPGAAGAPGEAGAPGAAGAAGADEGVGVMSGAVLVGTWMLFPHGPEPNGATTAALIHWESSRVGDAKSVGRSLVVQSQLESEDNMAVVPSEKLIWIVTRTPAGLLEVCPGEGYRLTPRIAKRFEWGARAVVYILGNLQLGVVEGDPTKNPLA